jgi:hypothetical protein
MNIDSTWGERALHHAHHIATRIGPRGVATPEEKQAADYAQPQLQQLGWHDVRVESFSTAPNGWLPITIIFSLAVWGVFACWIFFYLMQALATRTNAADTGSSAAAMLSLPGALVAAGLCCAALGLLYLEVTLRDSPLRRMARAISHNTIGHLAPAGPIKQRVVLVSSLDTTPAAPVFKTPRRARLFRAVFYLGSLSLVGSVVLYLLGGLEIWSWAFIFAGIFGLLQSAVIVQSLRADHGAFTPGANHNASGVGTVLALAERLRGTPLQNTEIWAAFCGSRTSSGGLRELLRQHGDELGTAWFIGLEGVGVGDRLVAIQREGWLRRSIQPAVRDLIARAAAANPDRTVAIRSTSRNTVVTAALWRGYQSVCLSIYDQRDEIPFAHDLGDTVEHLQLASLDAAQEFGWELLQQIDRGERAGTAD